MKYRPLMIVGSGSDVGKSLMAAGLCRIFRQEGIRVAPFKAQNMALNSFITPEGGEMGRAQVVQAQAAGLAPHVDMNPILLKPSSQVGSQVIVQGKVYGNFSAQEYYRHKPRLVRKVMESYLRLSEAYELIILEGAGSAVELNLKKNDLVNFQMAKKAGAAVLLVADIDRGGVFAATIGSFHLLTPAERRLLAGFIINKFRGDPALFKEGERIIEKRTGRPVLGVLPYAPDLVIPEEDSVALGRKHCSGDWSETSCLRIGVVRLPHISNYTDFDPLEQEPGVSLRYLDHRGYQLLGMEIQDPLGVEGPPRTQKGLGLLPVVTTMAGAKTTTQVQARTPAAGGGGPTIEAYEIHMGVTEPRGQGQPAFEISSRNGMPVSVKDGWVSPDRRVWGTYLHGLFDNDEFRRVFLAEVCQAHRQPQEASPGMSFRDFQEAQLDRLADLMRNHLDMARIRAMIQP
ncbi:MAG: cobyric acid synthase [Deltaproteobacteria bacterium]|nr:cobyric acid synthase [Deltaproteobacteria bacterium]